MPRPDRLLSTPETLAEKVKRLSPPEQLRLAAGLLEMQRAQTALAVIRIVEMNLSMALLLAEHDREKPR